MNILSFDVEEPWHTIPRKPEYERACSPINIPLFFERLEELIDRNRVTPIFFWVGTVAQRHKGIVRRLSENGYIIASHSHDHEDFSSLSGKTLIEHLTSSKKHLEDIIGKEVQSFRAPAFSLGHLDEFWSALEEAGFQYDFSICDAPRITGGGHKSGFTHPTRISDHSIIEFPMSYNRIFGKELYVTGGGYFRIAPPQLIDLFQSKLDYNMYYLHPIDFMRPTFRDQDPRSTQQKMRQELRWGDPGKKLVHCIRNYNWHTGTETEWAQHYE